jgi:hypothetical protein
MLGRWRIGGTFDGWVLVDAEAASPRDRGAALARGAATAAAERLIVTGAAGSAAGLRSAARWLESGLVASPSVGPADYKRIILRALASGDLLLVRHELRIAHARPQVKQAALEPIAAAPPDDDAWIELIFTDDRGRPLAGRAVSLALAGGGTRSGALDGSGFFRMSGIKPGTVDVSFAAPANPTHAHEELPDIEHAPPLPDPEPRVQVRLVDRQSGQPLAELAWTLVGPDGSEVARGVTDETGQIDAAVDQPGTFELAFGRADDEAPAAAA